LFGGVVRPSVSRVRVCGSENFWPRPGPASLSKARMHAARPPPASCNNAVIISLPEKFQTNERTPISRDLMFPIQTHLVLECRRRPEATLSRLDVVKSALPFADKNILLLRTVLRRDTDSTRYCSESVHVQLPRMAHGSWHRRPYGNGIEFKFPQLHTHTPSTLEPGAARPGCSSLCVWPLASRSGWHVRPVRATTF